MNKITEMIKNGMRFRSYQRSLVETFNDEQLLKVKMLSNKQDKYLFDYGILEIAIEDKLVETNVEQAEEVIGAPKGALTNVDVVIARIIRTLDKHFDEDVKFKYMSAIELDPIAPELKYLTSLVKQMI